MRANGFAALFAFAVAIFMAVVAGILFHRGQWPSGMLTLGLMSLNLLSSYVNYKIYKGRTR